MWSRIYRSFGLFGPAAPETKPIVPPETSTDASPPPRAPSPTYSPPPSPDRNVVPPDAPELRPCPPTIQWMAKIAAMQTSGMEYDNAIFANNIVGYHRAPLWLAAFVARWLPTYVPTIRHDLLASPSRCAEEISLRMVPACSERTLQCRPDARGHLPLRTHRADEPRT